MFQHKYGGFGLFTSFIVCFFFLFIFSPLDGISQRVEMLDILLRVASILFASLISS